MAERRLRIVAADDEPDMRDFFVKVLAHLGHDVIAVAADGVELVEKCRELDPDLIITDIVMPNMDGVEALRAIGQERPVPGIIVSAHHDDELVRRALHEQVLAFLVKPITMEDLQPAIALAMQRNREFEALHAQAERPQAGAGRPQTPRTRQGDSDGENQSHRTGSISPVTTALKQPEPQNG